MKQPTKLIALAALTIASILSATSALATMSESGCASLEKEIKSLNSVVDDGTGECLMSAEAALRDLMTNYNAECGRVTGKQMIFTRSGC